MDLISNYSIIPDSPAPKKKDTLMPTSNKIYIHIIEYYSALKKNKVLVYASTRMNLASILSKRSQSKYPSTHTELVSSWDKRGAFRILMDIRSCLGSEEAGENILALYADNHMTLSIELHTLNGLPLRIPF